MRLLTLLFLLVSFACFGQFKDKQQSETKPDSVKSITLTPLQEKKLLEYDKQIQELQAKQKELLEFIFDSQLVPLDRVKSIKYEQGKIIYILL